MNKGKKWNNFQDRKLLTVASPLVPVFFSVPYMFPAHRVLGQWGEGIHREGFSLGDCMGNIWPVHLLLGPDCMAHPDMELSKLFLICSTLYWAGDSHHGVDSSGAYTLAAISKNSHSKSSFCYLPPSDAIPLPGTAKLVSAPTLKSCPQAVQPAWAFPLASHLAFAIAASPSLFGTGPACWP